MSQSSDPKLIQFLTNKRNVGCVLEVLRHSEAIRSKLDEQFWSELRSHLKKTAPLRIGKKFKWETGSHHTAKEGWVWLDAPIPQFKDCPQSLSFRVEYWTRSGGLDLYYGHHWKKEIKTSSKHSSLKPVQNLRRLLEQEEYDFDAWDWWLGYKDVRMFASPDDFLSFYTENPKVLFQTVSEAFWPFVESTFSQVEKVNRALKA